MSDEMAHGTTPCAIGISTKKMTSDKRKDNQRGTTTLFNYGSSVISPRSYQPSG